MTLMITIKEPKGSPREKAIELIQGFKGFLQVIDQIPNNEWFDFTPNSYEIWQSAPMEEHMGTNLENREVTTLRESIQVLISDEKNKVENRVFVINGHIRIGEIRAPGYIWMSTSDYWSRYQGHIRLDAFKSNASTSSFGEMIQNNIEHISPDVLHFLQNVSSKFKKYLSIKTIDIAIDGGFDDIRKYVGMYDGHIMKKARDTRFFNLLTSTLEAYKDIEEMETPKLIDYIKRESLRNWLEYRQYYNFYKASMLKNGLVRDEGNSVIFVAKRPTSFKDVFRDFQEVIFRPVSDVFESQEDIRKKLRERWDDRIKQYLKKYEGTIEEQKTF